MIRVMIVDDLPEARLGLRWSMSTDPEIIVVAECSSGEDATKKAIDLRPEVITMDIRMPGIGGLSALEEILVATDARVLMMTSYDLDEPAFEALEIGASGFLTKDADPALLVGAIRSVANGDAVLTPRLTAELLRLKHIPRRTQELPEITAREKDFIRLIGLGYTNAEIAEQLCLSVGGVKVSISRLLAKMGLRHRVQIVRFAYEYGVV